MSEKTRVLGIVPYEGMKRLMEQIIRKRDDIDLVAYVGDLQEGADIAAKYSASDFDVIISRGGTAEMIRQRTSLPIVEIPLSLYDILRSIKLAENNNKFAIVGFPAITQSAHFLCDVLRYDLAIYTIHNQSEAESALREIVASNCNLVLCDMITNSLAQRQGIPAILITSGTESIESAFEQAIQTKRTYKGLIDQIAFYKALLSGARHRIYAYGSEGKPSFTPDDQPPPAPVAEKMASAIDSVLSGRQKVLTVEVEDTQYSISGSRLTLSDDIYAVFETSARKMPLTLSKNGFSYSDKEEAFDEFFGSFYGITQSTSAIGRTIEQCLEGQQPLIILGEEGTGKEQMLRLIYAQSKWSGNPLITIDCTRLHERGWKFLMESDNSPLCDRDNSIYIKRVEELSDSQFQELIAEIDNTSCHRQNRLYFVHTLDSKAGIGRRAQYLVNHYACRTVTMPPLRSHKEDIPNLASIYISILNMELVKQVIGFEPEAMRLLQALDWPNNYDQFKRIIHELVRVTDSPYISSKDVRGLLRKEQALFYGSGSDNVLPIDLSGNLEAINLNILRIVLAEEHGNQKAAAERLGISRTTLWRMMQKMGAEALSRYEAVRAPR